MLTDSSKINGVNYTVLIISDLNNPTLFEFLDLHVPTDSISAMTLKEKIPGSLKKILKSFLNLRLAVTDAASYNRLAFEQLAIYYPLLQMGSCYCHLLDNICKRISAYYDDALSLITKVNDFYSRLSVTKFLNILLPPPNVIETK